MKKLKLYVVTAFLIFGGTQLGFGQEDHSQDGKAMHNANCAKNMDAMVGSLDLTDGQKAKIKEIRKSYQTKIEVAKDRKGVSEDAIQKEIKELRQKEHYEVKNQLNDEQKKKLEEACAKHKMNPEDRIQSRIDKLDSIVALSDDQKIKVRSTLEDFGQKKDEIRKNTALSKEDKEAQMKQLRKDQKASMDEILNDKQKGLLKEHNAERQKMRKERKAQGTKSTLQKEN